MEVTRKPLQGISNILRFNWDFYLVTIVFVFILIIILPHFIPSLAVWFILIGGVVFTALIISMVASFYVYDASDLYEFEWMDDLPINDADLIANINAGFDEISETITSNFPRNKLSVFDFFDPEKHTEKSIHRARFIYPSPPGTILIDTSINSLPKEKFKYIFLIFSAHEIRDDAERITFFKGIKNSMQKGGKLFMVEHLRDASNFTVYNIGFLHFLSKKSWLKTIKESGLNLHSEKKINPFVSLFEITK